MKPLKGVRVIDLTRHLPGPFATHLLGAQGADVVKVELPQMPDPGRSFPWFGLVNAGKRSLCLDFAKPEGKDALLKLLATSRVLVEGFRPGLLERLGLGYAALKRRFPKLVYCSITGYGRSGPRARWSGHDLNYEAMGGVLSQTGELPPVPIADLAGSFHAAFSIAAALRAPEGCLLDISMTDASASLLVFPAGDVAAGLTSPGKGGGWWSGAHPFYSIYDARDGRVAVAALEAGYALRLLHLMGRSDLEPLAEKPLQNAAALRAELAKYFAQRPLSHWETLADKEACLTPIWDVAAVLKETRPFFGRPDAVSPLGRDGVRLLRGAGCGPAELKALRKKRILAV